MPAGEGQEVSGGEEDGQVSAGVEMLPAEVPPVEERASPTGEVQSASCEVQAMEEQASPSLELKPVEEPTSPLSEVQPMDTGMPSRSAEPQTVNQNTCPPLDVPADVAALGTCSPSTGEVQPSPSAGAAQPPSEDAITSPPGVERPGSDSTEPLEGSGSSSETNAADVQPSEIQPTTTAAEVQPSGEDARLSSEGVQSSEESSADVQLPKDAAPHQLTELSPTSMAVASDDYVPPPTDPPLTTAGDQPTHAPRSASDQPTPAPWSAGDEPTDGDRPPALCTADNDQTDAGTSPAAFPVKPAKSPAGPEASPNGPGASPDGPGASSPDVRAAAAVREGDHRQDADTEEGGEDDSPRLQASDLTPPEEADSAGLPAGSALELVNPESADRLCAAAVHRTAGHLVWLRLLSAAG